MRQVWDWWERMTLPWIVVAVDWECFGWLLWSHLDCVTAGDSRGAWRQCVFLVGRVVWCFLMHTCVQGQAPENGCM